MSLSTFSRPFSALHGLLSLSVAVLSMFACSSAHATWYRGNMHCHTTNSDGSLSVYNVCKFYYDRGYHFVVITDHDKRTAVSTAQGQFDSAGYNFRIVPGEEVSNRVAGEMVHTNGINLTSAFTVPDSSSIVNTFQAHYDGINSRSGVAMINHPFHNPNITANTMASVTGVSIIENRFTAEYEDAWDNLLSRNRMWYCAATDDTHNTAGFPDRWVWVDATALTSDAIEAALRAGNFYPSNGVKFNSITKANNTLSLSIASVSGHTYTTTFFGKDGVVLATSTSLTPSYTMTTQLYVRAKTVDNTSGKQAWSQPYFRVIPTTIDDTPVCSANWSTGTSATDKYGPDYRFRSTAAVSDTAQFSFTVATTGNYDISAWWSQGVNRSTTAPYILPDSTSLYVNQQANGGKWNLLGTKNLATGSQTVQLSCWTTTGYVVIADAVKFYGPK